MHRKEREGEEEVARRKVDREERRGVVRWKVIGRREGRVETGRGGLS